MARSIELPIAEMFAPFLQPSRYKGSYGGRGGAKSHAFADLLIERCLLKSGTRWACVREYQTSTAQSVKLLLEDKIRQHDLESEFRILDTQIKTPGDGRIVFVGMQAQTKDSIKSFEGFDGAWIEEAQSLSARSLSLLRPTIRKQYDDGTYSEIWASWNPRFAADPIDNFFRGNAPRGDYEPPWAEPPDSIVVRSSYLDNPFLPDVLRLEAEWDRAHDYEKYEHIWLGEYEQHSESRVFKNWRVEEFETPDDAMLYYGADWGFSVDPSVLVRCWIRGRSLFIDYESYRIGVEIDHLPAHFDLVPGAKEWPITADSARPETISYLKNHGFPKIEAAVKGANSVKEGIIFLQGYDIVVHPRCTHTRDELTHYSYVFDKKSNTVTPILEDKKNHVIDSLRYALEKVRAPKTIKRSVVVRS